jgi:heme-degrading monooxygenase HmoA
MRMPDPPQIEQSTAASVMAPLSAGLSMPASIALAWRRAAALRRLQTRVSRGKVEMYVIVWEFVVRPEKMDAFVAAYKFDGAWAHLFAQADGYIGTELLLATERDQGATERDQGTTYITIDRWKAAEDFTRFQEQFGDEYKALDTKLEGLTVSERKLGTFISED